MARRKVAHPGSQSQSIPRRHVDGRGCDLAKGHAGREKPFADPAVPPTNSPTDELFRSVKTTATPRLSPPPPPNRHLSEERSTRVEISFERFEKIVLRLPNPKITKAAIRQVAQSIMNSPEWTQLSIAHRDAYILPPGAKQFSTNHEKPIVALLSFISEHGRTIEVEGIPVAPLI